MQALRAADHAYILETGEIVRQGTGAELGQDESVRAAYLGGDV
jgi:branched-chain amino acid transport system ATP-binding protein